ncbi:hypothetical protein MKX03_011298 [Papaver bracteatum]|nr:hypothetical protein MKX03_011298 [Papaver bracteatum]
MARKHNKGKAPMKQQIATESAQTTRGVKIRNHWKHNCIEDITKQLETPYLEMFEDSCIGHFKHLPYINLYTNVFHNVLLRRKYAPKKDKEEVDSMSFIIGVDQEICFGEREFALLSGLKFQGSELINHHPNGSRLKEVHFPGKDSVTLDDLIKKFRQLPQGLDKLKLGLLYIAENVILGRRSDMTVDKGHFLLVDNLKEFNTYPWGELSYKATVKYLISLSEKTQISEEKSIPRIVHYNVYGFPLVFQAWIFHRIPVLKEKYTVKNEDRPKALHPRILHLKRTKSKAPIHVKNRIDLSNEKIKVSPPLHPTTQELKEGYMAGFSNDGEEISYENSGILELNGEDISTQQWEANNYSNPTNSLVRSHLLIDSIDKPKSIKKKNTKLSWKEVDKQNADSPESLKLKLRSEIGKLQKEREELRSDNYKLMEEKATLDKGKALLESEIESLRNEKTNLGKESVLLKKEKCEVETDLEFLQDEKNKLHCDIKSLNKEKAKLVTDLEFTNKEKNKLRSDVELLSEKKDKLQYDFQFLNEEKVKLGAHTELLSKEKTRLQSDFECLNREKSTVQVDICSLNGKKITVQDDICLLNEKKTTVIGDIRSLIEKKTILESEIKSLSNEKTNLGNETDLLNKEKTKLQGGVCSLNETKAILESDIESLSNEKINLGNATALLSKEKTKLQSAFESLDKNKIVLDSEIESLSNVKRKLVTETEFLGKEKTGLRDEKNKLHKNIESLNKKRAKLGTDLELTNKEKDKLQNDIEFLNEEKDKLQEFLIETKAEFIHSDKSDVNDTGLNFKRSQRGMDVLVRNGKCVLESDFDSNDIESSNKEKANKLGAKEIIADLKQQLDNERHALQVTLLLQIPEPGLVPPKEKQNTKKRKKTSSYSDG